ncbi:MAG: ferritin-like domain-containing protein [Gemmatimonadetes bacterium]|nr:ferritin-like domain-containing protein [Gemmatimonadota bacterium]
MTRGTNTGEKELEFLARLAQPTGRRTFLKWSGLSFAVVAAGCSDNRLLQPDGEARRQEHDGTISLGTGDEAVLNYAYVLEQLEAAFFVQVMAAARNGTLNLQPREFLVLDDLRKHELIHREFYATAIPALGLTAIPELEFDFVLGGAGVDFSSRESVLVTAAVLEDLGVSAYNGAAQLIQNLAILAVAGKIVSNEARHASAVRDLVETAGFGGQNGRRQFFAGRMMSTTVTESTSLGTATAMVTGFGQPDPAAGVLGGVLEQNGLDLFRVPAQILPLAAPFIVGAENLDASGLPTPGFTG